MQELRDDEMVNVDGGARLGPTLRDLHQRFGGTARTAVHPVGRVVFVSDTEAVGGSPSGWVLRPTFPRTVGLRSSWTVGGR